MIHFSYEKYLGEIIVDKYEYNIKADQILKLIERKDFLTAAKIADGIDWNRVKKINMLINIACVYEAVERYKDAKDILLIAFERAPISRRLAFKLTEVSIEEGNAADAQEYYNEFVRLAPRDMGRYELLYKLNKMKGASVEVLISILEEYKAQDFEEAWSYELALLYDKAGMVTECISECDDIILWFGGGEYALKAMELKKQYASLTPEQEQKYVLKKKGIEELSYERTEEDSEVSIEEADTIEEQPQMEQEEGAKDASENDIQMQESKLADNISAILNSDQREVEREEQAPLEKTGKIYENHIEYKDSRKPENIGNVEDIASIHERKRKSAVVKRYTAELTETDRKSIEAVFKLENRKKGQTASDEEVTAPVSENKSDLVNKRETLFLNDEQKKVFVKYLNMNGVEKELENIFQEFIELGEEKTTSITGNFMVEGDPKVGKSSLALDLIRMLNKTINRRGRRLAKTSGERLNNKGIPETIARLAGSDLLIERAGELSKKTIKDLLEALVGETGGMIVALEDTAEGIERLINEIPEIQNLFNHKFILKEFEISEWVELARQYAAERDYGIDDMATLALSAKLDSVYSRKSRIEMADVKEVVDAAIEKSEKKNLKKIIDIVFSRKYKDSDLTMLRENDFD